MVVYSIIQVLVTNAIIVYSINYY